MSYVLRIGGTCDFVSNINPNDSTCYPPGSVSIVTGWNHPQSLFFESQPEAEAAAEEVARIEGFPTSIEVL